MKAGSHLSASTEHKYTHMEKHDLSDPGQQKMMLLLEDSENKIFFSTEKHFCRQKKLQP